MTSQFTKRSNSNEHIKSHICRISRTDPLTNNFRLPKNIVQKKLQPTTNLGWYNIVFHSNQKINNMNSDTNEESNQILNL